MVFIASANLILTTLSVNLLECCFNSFLIAGIIGNSIDRIILGYVRDFIDLGFWPVFNLADSFNVIGVLILMWIILKEDKKNKN